MNGIMVIRKEKGDTSHDVVAKLRKILGQKRIGHTGTLDPMAEGVLPVCLGNATKVCSLLSGWRKSYQAVLQLGVTTDTQDATGTVTRTAPVLASPAQIEEKILSFIGPYAQIPPMYSAVHRDGKRLYELARAGIVVEREPREVYIYSIDVERIDQAKNQVFFTVDCSKGTYIRTLCADIGEALGCGGMMAALTRTRVGMFSLAQAVSLGQVQELQQAGKLQTVVYGVDTLFPDWGSCMVTEEAERKVRNGNFFHVEEAKLLFGDPDHLRVYSPDGIFLALYVREEGTTLFRPYRMFLPETISGK